jgi:hypothetical protein
MTEKVGNVRSFVYEGSACRPGQGAPSSCKFGKNRATIQVAPVTSPLLSEEVNCHYTNSKNGNLETNNGSIAKSIAICRGEQRPGQHLPRNKINLRPRPAVDMSCGKSEL